MCDDEPTADTLDEHARDWLHARDIIAQALAELNPGCPLAHHEQNASAIIARLAQADPPLLLARPEELADE